MNNQHIDLLDELDDNLIQKCALAYSNLRKIKYSLKLFDQIEGKEYLITLSFSKERFAHAVGLEHLPSIQERLSGSSKFKYNARTRIYNDAKNGKYNISNLSDLDKQALCSSIEASYCPITKSKYTIVDRINLITELENNIEFGFSNKNIGRVFPWQQGHELKIPGEKTPRRSNIQADYILILQSPSHCDEKINIFLTCSGKTNNNGITEINVEANSIFLDGVDFSRGLSRRYFTIEAEKVTQNTRSTLYKGPNPSTTKYMKMEFRRNPPNINSQSGEAVIDNIHQSTNGQPDFSFFKKLKQFFTEKIAQLFEKIHLQRELSKTREQLSERDDQLFNVLEENKKNKLQLSERDDLLSEKDKHLTDSAKEIASLKEENSALSEKLEKMEKQKQLVTTAAKPTAQKSFLQGIGEMEHKQYKENAAKLQQQTPSNLKQPGNTNPPPKGTKR